VLAGQPVKKAQSPRGVAIKSWATNAGAKVSYSEKIAPMLIDNCVTCHRAGGIGPWQMTSYDVVKGFAPMIREVVRTKRMPPWHADPHTGVWDGDRSLSTEEKQTLVHWIEAGAPRGKGPDPLADLHKTWSEWAFGKPDMVIQVPEFDVPATGIVDYKRYVVANTLGRDVWVRATDVIPGDRTVVHHVIVGIFDPQLPERQRMISMSSPSLGAYVPGNGPTLYPQDTGVLVRGRVLRTQCTTHLGQGGTTRRARPVLPRRRADTTNTPRWRIRTSRFRRKRRSMRKRSRSSSRATSSSSADAARALRAAPRSSLPSIGWSRACCRCQVRLQLADDVHVREPKQIPAGTKISHDGVRQPVQNPATRIRTGPCRGRAVVRRDAVRRGAVPRADADGTT
jgi:hypothetical protein